MAGTAELVDYILALESYAEAREDLRALESGPQNSSYGVSFEEERKNRAARRDAERLRCEAARSKVAGIIAEHRAR